MPEGHFSGKCWAMQRYTHMGMAKNNAVRSIGSHSRADSMQSKGQNWCCARQQPNWSSSVRIRARIRFEDRRKEELCSCRGFTTARYDGGALRKEHIGLMAEKRCVAWRGECVESWKAGRKAGGGQRKHRAGGEVRLGAKIEVHPLALLRRRPDMMVCRC